MLRRRSGTQERDVVSPKCRARIRARLSSVHLPSVQNFPLAMADQPVIEASLSLPSSAPRNHKTLLHLQYSMISMVPSFLSK